MSESKYNESNPTQLSNDPIFVNDEIERIHRKIFHLRRTNNEIRKFYSNDPDCIQALNENVIVIEQNLNSLFVYFKLYHQLTQKQHFYTKLYESDLKHKEKLNKHSTYINNDNYNNKQQQTQRLKEFDLDYVAQKLREKTKELQQEKINKKLEQKKQKNDVSSNNDDNKIINNNNKQNDNNNDDDFIADDDGGFTL